jgi:hypothetical protein
LLLAGLVERAMWHDDERKAKIVGLLEEGDEIRQSIPLP